MASLYRRPYFMRPNASQSPSHQALAVACAPSRAPTAVHDANGSSGSKVIPVVLGRNGRRTGRRGAGALGVRSAPSVLRSPSMDAIVRSSTVAPALPRDALAREAARQAADRHRAGRRCEAVQIIIPLRAGAVRWAP